MLMVIVIFIIIIMQMITRSRIRIIRMIWQLTIKGKNIYLKQGCRMPALRMFIAGSIGRGEAADGSVAFGEILVKG